MHAVQVIVGALLLEPWYRRGIFSLYAIPANARAMLFDTWKRISQYPYITPNGFGGSIFLGSPLLVLLFRRAGRGTAIILLTLVLWTHGNTGGWQYSYRYATEPLPWMFLIMLECGPPARPRIETALFSISVLINAWATCLFLWTSYAAPDAKPSGADLLVRSRPPGRLSRAILKPTQSSANPQAEPRQ